MAITYEKALLIDSNDLSLTNLLRHEDHIEGTLYINNDNSDVTASFTRKADDYDLNIHIDGIYAMAFDEDFISLVNNEGCWNFAAESVVL